jgi:hypothetical protein
VKRKLGTGKYSLAIAIALLGVLMSGGAAAQQSSSQTSSLTTYTTPSYTVRVHWSTQQEVEQRCGANAVGCVSYATAAKPYADIWAQKPASFDDIDSICYLGGVVLRVVDGGGARTNTAEAQVEGSPSPTQTVLR